MAANYGSLITPAQMQKIAEATPGKIASSLWAYHGRRYATGTTKVLAKNAPAYMANVQEKYEQTLRWKVIWL